MIPELSVDKTGKKLEEIRISRTIVDHILESRMAVITEDAKVDERFNQSQSIMMYGLQSLMCVPMISRDNVIGLIQVISDNSLASFNEEDMFLLSLVSSIVAVAVENSRLVLDQQSTISKLKTAQSKLVDTQQKLLKKERLASVGQLAAGITHEIKNMLSPIMLADLIRQRFPDDKVVQEYADLILESHQRILSITNEVKALTSGQEDKYNKSLHRPAKTVEAVMHFLRWDNEVKRIPSSLEVLEDHLVEVDQAKLKQVLINLIRNASQAVDVLDGHVSVIVGAQDDEVFIKIVDNGDGISKEDIQKIWAPFFTTREGFGTGLGLHISKLIIERHGGRLTCDSVLKEGTTMTVWLPAHSG